MTSVAEPRSISPNAVASHDNTSRHSVPTSAQGRTPSSHLRPEDAFFAASPHKRTRKSSPLGRSDTVTPGTTTGSLGTSRRKSGRRPRTSKRAKDKWKKLLWVKQPYPDNYTDEETFLDQLKRNPRLRPYEFWSLVADSTIIVQHVASVIIFICCFTLIFQERVSPLTMVSWATAGTVFGWLVRDYWVGQALMESGDVDQYDAGVQFASDKDSSVNMGMRGPSSRTVSVVSSDAGQSQLHSRVPSLAASVDNLTMHTRDDTKTGLKGTLTSDTAVADTPTYYPSAQGHAPRFSPRNRERLATAKSAILIYCALLGLSPILKSLTKSTSPDSIWAMSSWLIIINVFTFDYGAGVEAKFPASLSTNAALMASTVLASRLPSTTHVFSITLFSIEVFGLFPVFRRHLRHHSYNGHLILTAFLVVSAGGGLCVTITGGGWIAAIIGVVLGVFLTGMTMGITSWWLIGMQRYKNEIRGPWDPARPIIRRHWD